ncbi:MAG TPA: methyltransferase domain-containing protein [Steroidobacteraceae bacterium]|jgi:SAM-dependent methyltransferase
MRTRQPEGSIYTDGAYLEATGGTWHLEDAPFKAREVVKILARHPEVRADTICEIGCGAGGILSELQKLLPNHTTFTGYEISPQAHALSTKTPTVRCEYVLGDAFADVSAFDLVLVMDVVEHVEDCFSFLRRATQKGRWKLYHIPLDAHASAILRGTNAWDGVGHIHLFTIETALKSVEHAGQRVVDWTLTEAALAKANKSVRTRMANLVRLAVGKFSRKLAARLIGGYSILVLAE